MSTNHEFTSGNWTGFYLESHRREPGWMHLYLDCDEQGVIKGEGIDYVGPWTLWGTFHVANKLCTWTKAYVNKHSVHYEGLLSEQGIIGEWNIRSFPRGRFHIWPEGMRPIYEDYLQNGIPIPADDPIFESMEDAFAKPLRQTD
jgi:hypothetical protein